jgi:hypothetical protein
MYYRPATKKCEITWKTSLIIAYFNNSDVQPSPRTEVRDHLDLLKTGEISVDMFWQRNYPWSIYEIRQALETIEQFKIDYVEGNTTLKDFIYQLINRIFVSPNNDFIILKISPTIVCEIIEEAEELKDGSKKEKAII